MTTRIPARGRFEGVSKVVRFNWPYYALAVAVIAVALYVLFNVELGGLARGIILVAAVIPALFIVSSLAASFYIYDVSDLHEWKWLARLLPAMPDAWLAVNAGYDETAGALNVIFDRAKGTTLDVFDPNVFTEASIYRARKFAAEKPHTSADLSDLPCDAASVHAIFVIMSAHEIRDPSLRRAFFAELHRIAAPDGRVIVVEHLRNLWNFIAFGHGVLHFYARTEWLRVALNSGFTLEDELHKTPFVRAFVFQKIVPARTT